MFKPILAILALTALSACATISEDTCRAGSWEALGYKDGRNGQTRGRLADVAKGCAKYGIRPDERAYLTGFDKGLPLYCTYDRGFSRGEQGSGPKAECEAIEAVAYLDGVADGAAVHALNSEYQALIRRYERTVDELADVELRLEDETLERDERKRLRKKIIRLENRMDEARIDIRAFERVNAFSRYDFG